MNRFKCFFTFIAFVWLWSCGFGALYFYFVSGEIAWLGTLLSAWALPVWMWIRYLWPRKFSSEQREPIAFATVLAGLAVALLADSEKGLAVYLAIYNLFVVLIYLFHLSALRHPPAPEVGELFPSVDVDDGSSWNAAEALHPPTTNGVLLLFLRGSFCADSRTQVIQLVELVPALQRNGVQLVLASTEAERHWQAILQHGVKAKALQLAPAGERNKPFVAPRGVPVWLRLLGLILPSSRRAAGSAEACRPSAWLIDADGRVVWRHLPANYRQPGEVALLRGQLSRLPE
jgi:hypothetical protein